LLLLPQPPDPAANHARAPAAAYHRHRIDAPPNSISFSSFLN